jgi:hypothetical protein
LVVVVALLLSDAFIFSCVHSINQLSQHQAQRLREMVMAGDPQARDLCFPAPPASSLAVSILLFMANKKQHANHPCVIIRAPDEYEYDSCKSSSCDDNAPAMHR